MFSVPNIALENSMACRVFRAVKLGFIKDVHNSLSYPSTLPSSRLRFGPDHDIALKQSTFDSKRDAQVNLEITKTTEIAQYPEDDYSYGKPALLKEGVASDQV
jgi:hypothetical protein